MKSAAPVVSALLMVWLAGCGNTARTGSGCVAIGSNLIPDS
jgi:hypothetical protein